MKRLSIIFALVFSCFNLQAQKYLPFYTAPANPPVSGTNMFLITFSAGGQLSGGPFTVGYSFTTGASAKTITALSYYNNIASNTQTHQIGIFDSSGTLLTPSVFVSLAGQPMGRITVNITPITLSASTTYYFGAFEAGTGDIWSDQTSSFTTTPVATVNAAVYASGGTFQKPNTTSSAGQMYDGLDFNYQ